MPRRLLRDGQIAIDEWQYVAEAAALAGAPLIVRFAEWQKEPDAWIARGGRMHGARLGVVLSPADQVELLAPHLTRFALVAAEFPGPGEGRGYTQARLLRERWNFTGELRATGYVRRDQLFFMARCGFNSFELPESELQDAFTAFSTFSAAYQTSNDRGLPLKLPRDIPANA
ncbi:MAG: hypothetical protein JWN58_2302 [Gammaproteobacteria bacterium]|jgi:uncharacterized protein (DUF934 family)|nr:hypothetical protein [Gammaproteobacteria bacterium]